MRLFVVTKQFTVRRDFLADRYGRTWHLPLELGRRGHQVHGAAGAYYDGHATTAGERSVGGGSVQWHGHRVRPYWPPSALNYLRSVRAQARACSAQAIYASMDAFHLAVGRITARALRVPLIVDFCDNYAAYGAAALPGVKASLRGAARAAAGLTFVSDPLRRHLVQHYSLKAPALTLENGVDESFLAAPPKPAARAALGLPRDRRLLGAAGSLDDSRGIGALYDAFRELAAQDDQLHLVLAGTPQRPPPAHPRVHVLGTLSTAQMPSFWRSLDVAAICIKDDAFGRYCFPYKLAECAAAGTPMVFPRFGFFAEPEAEAIGEAAAAADGASYAAAIRRQLERPRPPTWRPVTWAALAARLEAWLQALPGLG
jgi:glycosyltransferase involved in cell wall biosynthesis